MLVHFSLSELSFILIKYWRRMGPTNNTDAGYTDERTLNGLYVKLAFVFEVTSFSQTFSLFPLSAAYRV